MSQDWIQLGKSRKNTAYDLFPQGNSIDTVLKKIIYKTNYVISKSSQQNVSEWSICIAINAIRKQI